MKIVFYLVLIVSTSLPWGQVYAEESVFKTEFSCYSRIAGLAILSDKTRVTSHYFPPVTKDPEKLMAVEERLENQKVAKLYFFTEQGGYSYTVNQIKPEGIQEYHFLIKVDGTDRKVALDRIQSKELRSLVYSPGELDLPIRLPEERGQNMRRILIRALEEKVQNIKSTYSARAEMRRLALTGLLKNDLKIQDKTIPLERYFETLPEKIKGQIAARQYPAEYIKGLKECKQALGADERFDRLKQLIDQEMVKFSTVPGLNESRPETEFGTQ